VSCKIQNSKATFVIIYNLLKGSKIHLDIANQEHNEKGENRILILPSFSAGGKIRVASSQKSQQGKVLSLRSRQLLGYVLSNYVYALLDNRCDLSTNISNSHSFPYIFDPGWGGGGGTPRKVG